MTTWVRRASPSFEERRAAHNESSRRSYIKNRTLINERRREIYRNQKRHASSVKRPLEPLVRKAARLLEVEVNSGHSHAQRSSELAEAMDSIDRLAT
ncbi:hypothetical protein IW261DRAFT_1576334 [Armillaria novae-zelandiae]|uniref:Uncharacterized protein n=1 Tax=Armillaria novae-zelandiae TaxID=153914 RepID=A0AA39NBQ4_9AGAR|nr:hypothetical protein IW261DRAFT_1576334 [Armillaria novae-zelandiae]